MVKNILANSVNFRTSTFFTKFTYNSREVKKMNLGENNFLFKTFATLQGGSFVL